MRREQSLADLLADDTGNLRAEVADLLMGDGPQRGTRHQRFIPRWFILGLLALTFFVVAKFIASPMKNQAGDDGTQAYQQGRTVKIDHEQEPVQEAQPVSKENRFGKAKVFGYKVNIRQYPSLKGSIIRKTNQGDIFQVLSFSDGWYQILLENKQAAYIFGAYLLPIDFELSSHKVGVTRDGTKLLLTPSRYRCHYQVILPNGERRYIRKSHVRVIR
ncbi:MAG: SH3 domain-containing protein [Deltaproteobacteria bacterium]|nr:SH3 domain-containing protein [Deltaproteobacteria bacterium]